MTRLHAAACTYRIALGPRAGQKVLTWKVPALRLASQEALPPKGCVSAQGFSLHADTWCGPHQRQKLERLCRYITRPALGHKRLSRTRAGEVVLQLKTPYRDGTTHLVMTPLEFLQRVAALVPRPRLWPHRMCMELEGRHCVPNRNLERPDLWPGPSVCC